MTCGTPRSLFDRAHDPLNDATPRRKFFLLGPHWGHVASLRSGRRSSRPAKPPIPHRILTVSSAMLRRSFVPPFRLYNYNAETWEKIYSTHAGWDRNLLHQITPRMCNLLRVFFQWRHRGPQISAENMRHLAPGRLVQLLQTLGCSSSLLPSRAKGKKLLPQ